MTFFNSLSKSINVLLHLDSGTYAGDHQASPPAFSLRRYLLGPLYPTSLWHNMTPQITGLLVSQSATAPLGNRVNLSLT